MHLLKNDYDSKKDYKSHLKQKYMFDRNITKRISKIINLNQKINHNDLKHYFKSKKSRLKRFSTFNRPFFPGFLRKIQHYKKQKKSKTIQIRSKRNSKTIA